MQFGIFRCLSEILIYLHLAHMYGKCRTITHRWSIWACLWWTHKSPNRDSFEQKTPLYKSRHYDALQWRSSTPKSKNVFSRKYLFKNTLFQGILKAIRLFVYMTFPQRLVFKAAKFNINIWPLKQIPRVWVKFIFPFCPHGFPRFQSWRFLQIRLKQWLTWKKNASK